MRLHNNKYGSEGTPLIILHGLLGTADNWHVLAQRFATTFQVFAPDLRNHGRSPHDPSFSYALMAEDIVRWMDEEKVDKAHMIGHSMGGKTAMFLAINYPERIESQIVVDMAPKRYVRGHDHIFRDLFELPIHEIHRRSEAEQFLMDRGHTQAVVQFLLKNLGRNEEGKFFWKPALRYLYDGYDAIREEIHGLSNPLPTLFLKGEYSGYLAPDDWSAVLALFPKAQGWVLPQTDHWLHAENPEAFYHITTTFLLEQRLSGPGWSFPA